MRRLLECLCWNGTGPRRACVVKSLIDCCLSRVQCRACMYLRVGCVLISTMIAPGSVAMCYNGSLKGVAHCRGSLYQPARKQQGQKQEQDAHPVSCPGGRLGRVITPWRRSDEATP